jgi:hypothetical protein
VTTDRALAPQLAAAVDAAPSVVARSSGPFGGVAVHLSGGGRVEGIRRTVDSRWEVHVVMAWDSTVSLVEADILAAADRLGIVDPVDVYIDDIAAPPLALPVGDDLRAQRVVAPIVP